MSNVVYVCCRVVLVCGRILYMSVVRVCGRILHMFLFVAKYASLFVAEYSMCPCLWQNTVCVLVCDIIQYVSLFVTEYSMCPCFWQNTVCALVCGRIQYVSLLVAEYSMCPCLWQNTCPNYQNGKYFHLQVKGTVSREKLFT